MAQIRPKQIKLDTIGDLITADAASKGEVLPLGAVSTVLTSDLGSTNKPIWSYVTTLRDTSGNIGAEVLSGGPNHFTITGGNAGTDPQLTAVGVDTNIDILLTPKGTGEVLVPVSYTPVSQNALITKSYADSVATGLDVKNSVRLATSASGELSGFTYNAGNEPLGDVWTGVVAPVFDGESVADGDRVLIKDAADARGNGIFVYNAAAQTFTRTDDANASTGFGQVSGGMFTFVEEGDAQADTGWVASSPDGPATLGTDNIVMTQFASAGVINIVEGNGIDVAQFGVQYTVTASVDNATLTNNGGSGAQLASRDVNNVGTGTVLTSQGSGSDAIWQGIDLSGTNTVLTNTLSVTDGGTGLGTIPQGSVLVANSPDTLTALDGGSSAPSANQVLIYNYITDQLEWQDASGIVANAYGQINGDTGSATAATNADQISIVGAGGIATTAANGTPDTLTIDLDFTTLPTGSAGQIDGTEQIIINDGGTNYAISITDLTDGTVDRYNSITDGVNTENAALAGSTITFATGVGVALTVSNPDTVTADIDFASIPAGSAGQIDGTEEIIINDGGTIVTVTITDLIDANVQAYTTIGGDTGTATAATSSDTLNIVGGAGIATVAAEGTPDTLTIDIDFSTLTSVSTLSGTDQIIIDQGAGPVVTTLSEIISDVTDAYVTFNADTGSATADGQDAISIVGTGGIATTAADGSPDTLTIDLDFSTLTLVSVVSGSDQIIINQGGTNVVTTIDELINDVVGPTVDRYNAITDGVTTENAAAGGDTITFSSGAGVALTVSNPDTVTADIDFSTLTTVSVITGTDQIIVDQGAGPVITTIDEIFGDVAPSYGTINGDSGAATALGTNDTINIVGTGGIATTAANGSPDTLTIDLDFTTLPTGSAGQIDGTEQIIINDGGVNTVITLNDFVDTAAPSWSTINLAGNSTGGPLVADNAQDSVTITGGVGVNLVGGDNPETLTIEFSSAGFANASTIDAADELVFFDSSSSDAPTTITVANFISSNDIATDAYTTINGDTGSATADGPTDTINIVGTGGIATTAANGTPDTLTIDLDFTTLPAGSAGQIDGSEEIIINDGGVNTAVTINEVFQAANVGAVGEDEVTATGGVNEAFVGFFSNTPINDDAITVFFNGLALRSTGWTRTGTTLTLVDAVNGYSTESGDIISSRYEF